MACATPSPTPNPDALKFTLDVTLSERILADRGDDAEDPFTRALLAIEGVASVFGVNDFVTITREPGADWEPIIAGVQAAAGQLGADVAPPADEEVERARRILRDAVAPAPATPVDFGSSRRSSGDGT